MPACPKCRRCVVALSAVLLMFAPGAAGASGFSVARFASEHGHPTTDNATAIYFNPAALTLARGSRGFADLTLGLRRVTYTREPQPTDAPLAEDALGANSGRATLSNGLIGPALAGSVETQGFSFGLGWFTPFGAPLAWDRRAAFADHPRLAGAVDGVQRWHAIAGHMFTSYLSLAVARSFLERRIALGLAVNLLGSSIEDVRARGDGSNDVEQEGRALLAARGLSFSLAAGVLYQALDDRLWLGASYQSRPNVSGGMVLNGTAEGNLGVRTRADVDVSFDLPDIVRVGGRYRPERWFELRLFGDYTRWSAFDRQCIRFAGGACELMTDGSQRPGSAVLQNLPREYRDSVGLRIGASLFLPSEFEVFSGAGLSSSAVPDSTMDPALSDSMSVSFAVGVKTRIARRLRLGVSLTELLFVPRDVQSALSTYEVPSLQPDASGHYTQFAAALNVNLEVRL